MPRRYSGVCERCGIEYRGEGKKFCSKKCANNLRIHQIGFHAKHAHLINRAFSKGLGVLGAIEFNEWYSNQKKECFYCGVSEELHQAKFKEDLHIDRKNPEVGYYQNNMALACGICNRVKSDILTEFEMKEVAMKYIVKKYEVICGRG